MTKSYSLMPYRPEAPGFRFVLRVVATTLFVFSLSLLVRAAEPSPRPAAKSSTKAPPKKPDTPEAKEGEDERPPAPESHMRWTKHKAGRGWKIHLKYYPPKEPGKDRIPIIMLHGWGGNSGEYSYLATGLQAMGFACITVDFRDHGRSKQFSDPRRPPSVLERDARRWENEERLAKKGTSQPKYMFEDVEVAKRFLIEKNNEEELNIQLLCVVAAEEGCLVALQWAVRDWSFGPLPNGDKRGQDVRALVLLSPDRSFKGMTASPALSNPVISHQLSFLFLVGEGGRSASSDASRLYSPIERSRPEVVQEQRDVFFVKAPTELQGTKLLDKRLPNVTRAIVGFLNLRLVKKASDFPWAIRK